jgi:uncharacterized protein YndB with AHSA1/START domain
MEKSETKPRQSLELRRTFSASRDRIYRAWTDPAALSRWFSPTDRYETVVHELDLRVGGNYRIEMRHEGGARHVVTGTYRELAPPERLAFTWRWTETAGAVDSLVTVELIARGEATELVLKHERLDGVEEAREHEKGWVGCLAHLAATL